MDENNTRSVLFVGNSYTFFNSLWDLTRRCAASVGRPLTVDHVASGGYRLCQYLDPADPMSREFREKISQNWDAVILQEHSLGPIRDYPAFAGAVRSIRDALPQETRVILFETWGRREGSETLAELGMTSEAMTQALADAYHRVGRELGLAVSPVGEVFRRGLQAMPGIDLYASDLTHPSPEGSYLAALVHCAVLTGERPERVTFDGGLTPETAMALRRLTESCL